MENMRKHVNVRLVQTKDQLQKLSKKPSFASCQIFHEDLVGVEMKRSKVKLFKPSYSGMSILDISKFMFDFYNFLKKKYKDKLQLLMTDTDSLLFFVQCDEIYRDMHEN